jgi:hypothetical protein
LFVTPMTVERAYRGVNTPTVYVQHFDSLTVAAGQRLLVYGHQNYGDAHEVVMAWPGRPIAEVAEELVFLEKAIVSGGGGTVSGTLSTWQSDDTSMARKPLAGVTIHFLADGFAAHTLTGADGRFTMTGVPDGLVRVQPVLPEGLRVGSGATIARAGGCTPLSIIAEPDGRIRGRVLQRDGTPMMSRVDLIPADESGRSRSGPETVQTNEHGEFEFVGLRPGGYLVGVNLRTAATPSTPYPATFYPGTANRTEAAPIVIGAAEVRDRVEFTLGEPAGTGILEVRVEGNPQTDVVVCSTRSQSTKGALLSFSTYPARGGSVTIPVVDGITYTFFAHVERSGRHLESPIVALVGRTGHQTVTLRADFEGQPHEDAFTCEITISR